MRKQINRPYRCLMALALLLMPLGIFAQDNIIVPFLKFTNPNVQTHMQEVTTWTINWSERSGTYPKLQNDYQVDVDYSSSDESVATIDSKSGAITPVAPGTTIISASFEGLDSVFAAAYAEYTLTYTDDRYTVEDLGLHFSSSTVDATYGDATVDTPSLEMGKMPQDVSFTYSSSAPGVATVNATSGQITIVGAGSTVISASFAGNDNVKPGSVSYTLTVVQKEVGIEWGTTTFTYDGKAHAPKATATGLVGSDKCSVTVDGAQTNAGSYTATASDLSNANYMLPADGITTEFTISKGDATVTFASKSADAKIGEAFTSPTATTTPAGLTLAYTSSDLTVATVNESTGKVTLVAAGSTTIMAKFAGDDNLNSAEDSYTLTVSKADPVDAGLSFSSESATATYGDATVTCPTLSNPNKLSLTWSSSKKKVATVGADGTVTIVGAGETVISAAFAGNDSYKAQTVSFTLTVNKADATVTFASKSADAKIGEAFTSPTATTTPAGLTLAYTSSDPSVATVNESTGKVTLVAAGSTTITAKFAGDDNLNSAEGSYTLTVSKADPVDAGLSFSSESATATYGDATVSSPTLSNPNKLSLTWSSSNKKVATVGADGTVTIVGVGETVISAAFVGNDSYKAQTVSYTLTVNKANVTVTFTSKSADVKIGEAFTSPTATTTPAGLTLAYTSSAPAVATVNESTGKVTLVAAGSTTIKATFAGNDNYNSASDSYILTVSKADAVEVELSFDSESATATYGDATATPPALNNPKQLPLTWSSSNVKVATIGTDDRIMIVGAGETVISATFAGNDEYQGKTASFTLVVNKGSVKVSFDTKSETVTLGDDFTSPKATTTPPDLQLVYSTSDKHVAKVDHETGDVTLIGAGTARIAASFMGSDNYETGTAYYDLTVLEGTPMPTLEPIVKEQDYPMDEEYFVNADGSEVDLSNSIVNNILFTLKNQESPEGDGYDTEERCIVINTVTATSTVNALLASGVEPGSAEFASQFTGMTFLVSEGEGYIIVTSQEAEGFYLMVKVGANDPIAINMLEMGDYSIPYQSDTQTFVYLWNGGTEGASGTRGKKTASDTRVRKVSHKSRGSGIQQVLYDVSGDQPWYDLSGQRIMQPVKKGVYIHGNRKVVIK